MFSESCSRDLLRECMSNIMAARSPTFMKAILDLIDKHDGIIYGSSITAYVLRDSTLSNDSPRDVDILFRDQVAYSQFINDLIITKSQINKSMTNDLYYNDSISQSQELYSFSTLISTEPQSQTRVSIKLMQRTPRKMLAQLKLHLMYLQTGGTSEATSIVPGTFIKYLFDNLFPMDFLKVVYYRGGVYRKLSAINVVYLTEYERETHKKIIDKYVNRIRFEKSKQQISTQVRQCDLSTFDSAKQFYKSLGWVVIPLSTADSANAGKCPATRKWMTKDSSYDFSVRKVQNDLKKQNLEMNIGVVCGPNSGIVCIDVDVKDNGMYYFEKLVSNYGLPKCPTQMTPNGGRHFVFKYNEQKMRGMKAMIKGARIGIKKIGIDLWIDKCQFVVEPSINFSVGKMYKWIVPITSVEDIPELPDWIYDLYNNNEITEDGTIISKYTNRPLTDTSSVTTSETTKSNESMDSISNLSESPTNHVNESSKKKKVSFDLEIESPKSWIVAFILGLLIVFMGLFMLLTILISFLIMLLVPERFQETFKSRLVQYFRRCIYLFE